MKPDKRKFVLILIAISLLLSLGAAVIVAIYNQNVSLPYWMYPHLVIAGLIGKPKKNSWERPLPGKEEKQTINLFLILFYVVLFISIAAFIYLGTR